MFHLYYSSENVEIKRHINHHFTFVYLLGGNQTTVDTGTGEEPSIDTGKKAAATSPLYEEQQSPQSRGSKGIPARKGRW